jgi:hypothetical protein
VEVPLRSSRCRHVLLSLLMEHEGSVPSSRTISTLKFIDLEVLGGGDRRTHTALVVLLKPGCA